MGRPSSREAILDAFEETLISHGSAAATLDAIAEAAGVSKGGLLYHFASKDDLFVAFGERLLARIDTVVAAAPDAPAAVIRWYLDPQPIGSDEATLWRSIIAALHGTEALLAGVIPEAFDRFARPLAILDPTVAEQVRLVGDGLFLSSLVGIAPRPELAEVTEALVRLALE